MAPTCLMESISMQFRVTNTRLTSHHTICHIGITVCKTVSGLCRVIMSVNDKWHYCHNSEVLVGSRAMRDRHLRLLGYIILQVSRHPQLTHTVHI